MIRYVAEFPEITEENENIIFEQACKEAEHEDVVKVGNKYFQMHFGPEHDSWTELELPKNCVFKGKFGRKGCNCYHFCEVCGDQFDSILS